jgi:putative membrane protein
LLVDEKGVLQMNLLSSLRQENKKLLLVFILLFVAVWADSIIGTTDMANWIIENTLTVISLVFLISTYKAFRFNTFSYLLLCIFLCMHVYGSKYTYAENPLGFYLQDIFNSPRNQYDRIVHFSFGLLLFYPMWECFSKWLKYPKSISLSLPILWVVFVGAIYEIIEWLVADVFFAEQGISYLGTQGDIWDAQKDMAVAFVGVCLATLLFIFVTGLNKKR